MIPQLFLAAVALALGAVSVIRSEGREAAGWGVIVLAAYLLLSLTS